MCQYLIDLNPNITLSILLVVKEYFIGECSQNFCKFNPPPSLCHSRYLMRFIDYGKNTKTP